MKKYTFTLPKNNAFTSNNYYDLKSTIAKNIANKYDFFMSPEEPKEETTKILLINNLETEFYNASKTFTIYRYDLNNPFYTKDYDFEINGVPVRVYDDHFQVGYTIIPRNPSKSYYTTLRPEVKKIMIDITLKVNLMKTHANVFKF